MITPAGYCEKELCSRGLQRRGKGYATQEGNGIDALSDQRISRIPERRPIYHGRRDNISIGVANNVVWSEKNDIAVPGRRGVHCIVMDVGVFKWMEVVGISNTQVQMAVGRVSLGEVVVQHWAQGRSQQSHNCQKNQQWGRQLFQGVVQYS